MPDLLPEYESPPVVETALSIQFARLQGFSTALAGWFWQSFLSKVSSVRGNWAEARIEEEPRLEDVFERFGANDMWGRMGLKLSPPGEPQRTQIVSPGDERMVQVQDSRFVLNWRKRTGDYPRFSTLTPEFWSAFKAFEDFAKTAKMSAIEPNQWEMTYVNHIPKGDMWESPSDWRKILPSVSFPATAGADAIGETLSADWRFSLAKERARLYVSLRHAKTAPKNDEVLMLTLTARGPIDAASGLNAQDGFELGHKVIVSTFTAMTSPEAHKRWKRRR
jgi:uncharacterized protein (TIGR04255 family)